MTPIFPPIIPIMKRRARSRGASMRDDPHSKIALLLVPCIFTPFIALLLLLNEPSTMRIFWFALLCLGLVGWLVAYWMYQGYRDPSKYFNSKFMPAESKLGSRMLGWVLPAGLFSYAVVKVITWMSSTGWTSILGGLVSQGSGMCALTAYSLIKPDIRPTPRPLSSVLQYQSLQLVPWTKLKGWAANAGQLQRTLRSATWFFQVRASHCQLPTANCLAQDTLLLIAAAINSTSVSFFRIVPMVDFESLANRVSSNKNAIDIRKLSQGAFGGQSFRIQHLFW